MGQPGSNQAADFVPPTVTEASDPSTPCSGPATCASQPYRQLVTTYLSQLFHEHVLGPMLHPRMLPAVLCVGSYAAAAQKVP